MQPLNYTPKAIEALLSYPCTGAPGAAAGMRYVANKLRQAQVFVLGEHGQLLDRSKPRPEVPGLIFKPPFPVMALEYQSMTADWDEGQYTVSKCSRRISLAWEWQDDLPPILAGCVAPNLGPGVAILSIPFFDDRQAWTPISAAMHLSYESLWRHEIEPLPYQLAMQASGRLAKCKGPPRAMGMSPIGLFPEMIAVMLAQLGDRGTTDMLSADNMDEVNAYTDLCYALACKNVATKEHVPPAALNRQRIKAGKLPLKGFHVLELTGGGDMPGAGASHDRSAARSHLRRGHIRRLAADRVTWVNSTVVRGRGFVDKVYAA